MKVEEKLSPGKMVSVPVTNEMLHEIESRAARTGVSRCAFLGRLIQYGIEAETQKRDRFMLKMQKYRECADQAEVERLGNEIGEMIFG